MFMSIAIVMKYRNSDKIYLGTKKTAVMAVRLLILSHLTYGPLSE